MKPEQKALDQLFAVSYQKNLSHNYLVIRRPDEDGDDYEWTMVMENHVPCLLPMQSRTIDGHEDLYYEISSLQPLSRIYEHKEMSWPQVRHLTEQILDAYETIQDFLLDDAHIVLDPAYLYLNLDSQHVQLLFLPCYVRQREDSFLALAEYYMERVCHTDTNATIFAYRFYQLVKGGVYVPDDIRRLFGDETQDRLPPDPPIAPSVGDEDVHGHTDDDHHREQIAHTVETEPALRLSDEPIPVDAAPPKKNWLVLILPIVLIVLALAVASGAMAGVRGSSATPIAAALLLIGVGSLALQLRRRRRGASASAASSDDTAVMDTRSSLPGDLATSGAADAQGYEALFSDLEVRKTAPSPALTAARADDALWEDVGTPSMPRTDYEMFAEDGTDETAEIYGKTVFMDATEAPLDNILQVKGKQRQIPMTRFPFTIGKVKECVDLALKDGSVSRIHARILQEDGRLYLQDCHSTNGTYLNGMQLAAEEKVLLSREDEIGIGRLCFQLL